jgi:tetratricopeptide (TPR) repeat protein
MKLLDTFKQRLGLEPPPRYPNRPDTQALREAIDAGQRQKRAENYLEALESLGRAVDLALANGDSAAMAVAALNQAEVLMHLGREAEAEAILNRTYATAQDTRQKGQLAYTLIAMGRLAQHRNDWKAAQQHYQQALDIAHTGHAGGGEGRALGFMADVYLNDGNASYAIHLLREALPKLQMTGDLELSSYFVGRLGEALIASGQTAEGQQLLERALRLARQIGYRQHERRWSLVLGERALVEGRIDAAYEHLRDALTLFNAERQPAAMIPALCLMSRTCLIRQQVEEAVAFARKAVDLAAPLGQPFLSTQAEGALGLALVSRKAYVEAIALLKSAIETLRSQSIAAAGYSETDLIRALAAAQAELGDEAAAVAIYRQAVKEAEQSGSPLEVAQATRDLGLFFSKRLRLNDAIREWTAALHLYEAEKQHSQAARLYCDLAAARRFVGQGTRATRDLEQALMLLTHLHDDWETRGLVLANAAIAYVDQGDIDSADAFFNESIAIARRIGNETAEATRRGNYGWFLLMTGRLQQAQSTIEYALRSSQRLGLELAAAVQTSNLGLVQDAHASYPRALELHDEALRRVQPAANPHWEHLIQLNRAQTLLSLNRVDEAQPLFTAALDYARPVEDVEIIIRALCGLAKSAIREGQADGSGEQINEAVQLARRADLRRLLAEALSLRAEMQALSGQRDEASRAWSEAQKLFAMLQAPQARMLPSWL